MLLAVHCSQHNLSRLILFMPWCCSRGQAPGLFKGEWLLLLLAALSYDLVQGLPLLWAFKRLALEAKGEVINTFIAEHYEPLR